MPSTLVPRRTAPPRFWRWLLCRYLHAPEALTRRLWRIFEAECPQAVRWQIEQCSRTDATPDAIDQFCALVRPNDLVNAIEQLCLRDKRRRPEVIALEEAVLQRTAKDGSWV